MFAVNPSVLALGKVEYKPSETTPQSSASVTSITKPLPKELDLSNIPTFVPRYVIGSGELVWSPTSGTRQRRPDEMYHRYNSTIPAANPAYSRQATSQNVSSAYNLKAQYLFHGSRDLSDTPTKSHRRSDSLRLTPPPQSKSTQSPLNPSAVPFNRSRGKLNSRRKRRNNFGETPFPDSIDGKIGMATFDQDFGGRYSSGSQFESASHPVNYVSRKNPSSHFQGPRYPTNQARGVYGAEPFSAPPSIPSYGNRNQTSHGMYGGSTSPFEGQLGQFGQLDHFKSRPDVTPSQPVASQGPYVPNPEIWATESSRPRNGPQMPPQTPSQIQYQMSKQIPGQMIQPTPQRVAQGQIHPLATQAATGETFSIPPPGFMRPLDYWNMLAQRESEIRTRLQLANRSMTDQERQYIFLLGEARINAAATQMPARNGMSKGKWLAELGRTLRSIWKTGPGGMGFSQLVVARKTDFENAIQREIDWVSSQEKNHGEFGSALNRAYGA